MFGLDIIKKELKEYGDKLLQKFETTNNLLRGIQALQSIIINQNDMSPELQAMYMKIMTTMKDV